MSVLLHKHQICAMLCSVLGPVLVPGLSVMFVTSFQLKQALWNCSVVIVTLQITALISQGPFHWTSKSMTPLTPVSFSPYPSSPLLITALVLCSLCSGLQEVKRRDLFVGGSVLQACRRRLSVLPLPDAI